MVRIPDAGPLRAAPRRRRRQSLSAAGCILVAGLDGIKNKRDPGKRLDIDMYAEGHKVTKRGGCRSICSTRCGHSSNRQC